jgi:hypothetical protein
LGRLIYGMSVSLDGFIDTPSHSLDWALVDDELPRTEPPCASACSASRGLRFAGEYFSPAWDGVEACSVPASVVARGSSAAC